MKIARGAFSGTMALAAAFAAAGSLTAQSTKVPSTLRYGSGLLDVPVASVLPHMAIVGTYSGFPVSIDQTVQTNAAGDIVGRGAAYEKWLSDASIAIGLFDRVEAGVTVQNFSDAESGGSMVGAFGRVAIVRPEAQGLGLAVGARYVSPPSFDNTSRDDYQPSRLGFPDARLTETYGANSGRDDVNTQFTPYVVGTAQLRGFDSDIFPEHDFTFSVGWGAGMFKDGDQLPWYSFADSEGWFTGAALHMALGETSLLNLIGEWNGFDINLGAQADFGGFRIGGFLLGANYAEEVSIYRSKKFGVLGSVALCPQTGGLCKPGLLDRPMPDTIVLPAPPPDTVVVERTVAPPLPTGTSTPICLATGATETVLVTAQGDTLVGPQRVSVRQLRPGVVFAGSYAEGASWFENDDAVTFERRNYSKSGGEVRLSCNDIMQVGEFNGVPLFADRGGSTPYQTLYVPVRPGVWQAYQSGLQRTRG
ncbi:MAG: hypothetical protein R3E98_06335 [Gemmatimonadota bacterium]|nr:hypothetical protein [Gemmatimonadota bacterium]